MIATNNDNRIIDYSTRSLFSAICDTDYLKFDNQADKKRFLTRCALNATSVYPHGISVKDECLEYVRTGVFEFMAKDLWEFMQEMKRG